MPNRRKKTIPWWDRARRRPRDASSTKMTAYLGLGEDVGGHFHHREVALADRLLERVKSHADEFAHRELLRHFIVRRRRGCHFFPIFQLPRAVANRLLVAACRTIRAERCHRDCPVTSAARHSNSFFRRLRKPDRKPDELCAYVRARAFSFLSFSLYLSLSISDGKRQFVLCYTDKQIVADHSYNP